MIENATSVEERVKESDQFAFRLQAAARLLGISYSSLRREIQRRKIFVMPSLKLVSKKEILRYIEEEEQLARRQRNRTKKRVCQNS